MYAMHLNFLQFGGFYYDFQSKLKSIEQVHGITGTDSDAPPSSEHKSSSTVTHTNTSNIPSNNQVQS